MTPQPGAATQPDAFEAARLLAAKIALETFARRLSDAPVQIATRIMQMPRPPLSHFLFALIAPAALTLLVLVA